MSISRKNRRAGQNRPDRFTRPGLEGTIESRQAEIDVLIGILEALSRSRHMNEYLEQLIKHTRNYSGCRCVGIRLLDDEGNIPYVSYAGFSRKFYESESPLSIGSDKCMCINVIKGNTDPGLSFYTDGGSFLSNGTTKLLASVPEETKGQTRNVCNQYGYESVALVPMRHKDRILGLIHLADESENKIPIERVRFLERVGAYISEALHTFVAEEALKKSEKKYRSLISNIPDVAWTSDENYRTVFVSPNIERLTGYTQEEEYQLGNWMKWLDRLHPDDIEKAKAALWGFIKGKQPYDIEYRFQRKDGRWIWIHDRSVGTYEKDGKIYADGLFSDITERKKLEHSLRERIKELQCLYSIANIAQRPGIALDEICEEIANVLPQSWQYPEIACARITIDGKEFRTSNYRESEWEQSAGIKVRRAKAGEVEVNYLEERPEVHEGPFLKEERLLIDAIAEQLGNTIERKWAEEELKSSRDYLKKLTDSMWDAVFSVKMPERVIEWANDSFRLTGYEPEECIGKTTQFLYPDERGFFTFGDKLKSAIAGGKDILHTEQLLKRKSGEVFPAEITTTFFKEKGKVVRVTSIVRDVTDRKKLEQLKDDFISLVSHELRTPLTVIMGSLDTVLGEGARLSPDETRQLLQDAAQETESLSHLLGNLLELSRAQAERLFLYTEPVSIQKVVQETVDKIKRQSSTHRFVIDLAKEPPPVHADPLRVERILYNLLENAVKYSPRGSEIRVFAKPDREYLVIGVSDQGVGISPSDQVKLFRPFQRLEQSRLEGVKGAGLGLLVCRRLVEAHGGRIWLESEVDRGSTFLFTLPLEQVAI